MSGPAAVPHDSADDTPKSIRQWLRRASVAINFLLKGATTTTAGIGKIKPMSVTFHANIAGTLQHASFPAALTALGNQTRAYTKVDLTNFTQARLIVNKQGSAANTGAKLVLRYYTASSFTASNYVAMGSSEISVAVDTTNAVLDSGWVDLVAGARADVFVNVFGIDGDNAASPFFGSVSAQFR
jgi:hypothetical protein